jgi:hypothetical protein
MRWVKLFAKIALALAFAALCAALPLADWMPPWFVTVQCSLVAFLFIAYISKLLIDTFFFDHYQP